MSKRKTNEEVVSKLTEKYGDEYDYSEVEYVNNHTPIWLTHKCGCRFQRDFKHLMRGQGCPDCNPNKNTPYTNGQFIEKMKYINPDIDCSEVNYAGSHTDIKVRCLICGHEWVTQPTNLLSKRGCPICANKRKNLERNNVCRENIAERVREIYGDEIEYVDGYTTMKQPAIFRCKKHGEFEKHVGHLIYNGQGCPKCHRNVSKQEEEVYSFIKEMFPDALQSSRDIIDGELDIFIPSKNIAVEYNGLYWHSDKFLEKNYHLEKTRQCEERSIRLIHIFEDEWNDRKEIVKSKLKSILGKDNSPVIYARKCSVKAIAKETAGELLNKYHIQGFANATVHYGLEYQNEIVAVMSFTEKKDDEWELVRFAGKYRIIGGAGKLLNHFIDEYHPVLIKSFADRRWSSPLSNVYERLGFTLDGFTDPDYRYLVNNERKHKFAFRKNKLNKKYGLPLTMTEREMTDALGFRRIYDCGLIRYIKKLEYT